MPWKSSVKQMNKEVFLRAGGLKYLLQLLRLVHTTNWTTSSRHVKLLEIVLLETLHPLAACFRFRRFVGFNVIIAVNGKYIYVYTYCTIIQVVGDTLAGNADFKDF